MSGRILVCDDEEGIRRSLKRVLEAEGYSVVTTASGPECLEKLQEYEIDLIILDLVMPGMDGGIVSSKIRENNEYDSIPIIYLSVLQSLPGEEERMKRMGVKYHLTKPFENEDLVSKVKSVIG